MAEFEIKANGKLNLFTREEFRDELRQWSAEVHRGIRFTRRSMAGDAAGGVLQLGRPYPGSTAYGAENLSPAGSFIWGIQRISAFGLGAAEVVSVYLNEAVTDNFVGQIGATPGFLSFQAGGLVLNDVDTIVVTGAGLTAGKRYGVNLSVAEVPIQLAYTLLGS